MSEKTYFAAKAFAHYSNGELIKYRENEKVDVSLISAKELENFIENKTIMTTEFETLEVEKNFGAIQIAYNSFIEQLSKFPDQEAVKSALKPLIKQRFDLDDIQIIDTTELESLKSQNETLTNQIADIKAKSKDAIAAEKEISKALKDENKDLKAQLKAASKTQ